MTDAIRLALAGYTLLTLAGGIFMTAIVNKTEKRGDAGFLAVAGLVVSLYGLAFIFCAWGMWS
ncbi:MAG: hypothetical protein KAY24_00355 [Candidatus Eisenbacteria sp.]|nr:hypothetical protein [Candidatus Eisenbacteria bacterium]